MKRAICICLLSSIVLTGCVSKADYEQLEERVSKLEQEQSRINESTTTTSTSATSTAAEPETSENNTETSDQESSSNYSLEGLSAEEIYAECKSIYQTIGGCSGMTKEDYLKLFNCRSANISGFYFDGEADYTIDNCITNICPDSVYEEMDGTVDHKDYLYIKINLRISDYKTAVDFYNLVVSDEKYKNDIYSNNQEGTRWSALVCGVYDYWYLIEMGKVDNAYYFTIQDYFE